MSLTKMHLNPKSVIPLSAVDIDANDAEPRFELGMHFPMMSAFGLQWLVYVKNNSGSDVALGNVLVKEADVLFTAGVVASATRVTTTGLTADQHVGKLLLVEGNDTTPGAAPEGETGVITSNTATQVDLDAGLPLSVASAADVDCRITTPFPGWHGTLGGANAVIRDVLGIVAGVNGITSKYYGWVIAEGYVPQAQFTSATVTAKASVITAASGQLATQAGAANLTVGYVPGTLETSHPTNMPVVMTLLSSKMNNAITIP